jgi:hypothetical protein
MSSFSSSNQRRFLAIVQVYGRPSLRGAPLAGFMDRDTAIALIIIVLALVALTILLRR